MWQFVGEIDYVCDECNHEMSMPIEHFTIENMGGSERGMGPENLIEIICEHSCENCDHEIKIHFEASEYPIGMLNFIEDYSEGAQALNEPETEDIDESPIYLLPEQEIILPDNRIITDFNSIRSVTPQLINFLKDNPQHLYQITPREFEEVVAEIFRSCGFSVELTQRTRDGGKDIIAIKNDSLGIETKYFIECKRHSQTNKVGVDIVRSLYGVNNTKDSANKSMIVTTSTFTRDAHNFVNNEIRSRWEMSLIDYNRIIEWIQGYSPQTMSNLPLFNPYGRQSS